MLEACSGRSEQITGSEHDASSGRGTSEQALSGQHSHLQFTHKQGHAVPSTFTGLLVFQWIKNKSNPPPSPRHHLLHLTTYPKPDTRSRGEKGKCWPPDKYVLHICVLCCFGRPACCFPAAVGPKQSNQIAFVCDASQCGHSRAHNGEVYLAPTTRPSA